MAEAISKALVAQARAEESWEVGEGGGVVVVEGGVWREREMERLFTGGC